MNANELAKLTALAEKGFAFTDVFEAGPLRILYRVPTASTVAVIDPTFMRTVINGDKKPKKKSKNSKKIEAEKAAAEYARNMRVILKHVEDIKGLDITDREGMGWQDLPFSDQQYLFERLTQKFPVTFGEFMDAFNGQLAVENEELVK